MVAILTTAATGTLVSLVTKLTVVALGTVVVLVLCMSSCDVCCFCLILKKCLCREIPVKITNINFHTNISEVVHEDREKGEATDGRRVVTKLIDACLQLFCKKRSKI